MSIKRGEEKMSQTTKDYQYDRNDNNTFGVRGVASGGGTEVVANPEGEATTDLTKLQVDETIYGVPQPTTVVANPTLAGTEANLTGLQVGDTKYAVPTPIDVVANPVLAGTESNLTGLQVGNTKYAVLTPHTINTYSTGELSADDQAKIAVDISQGYPIQISNRIYSLHCDTQSETYWICSIAEGQTRGQYYLGVYNKTTHVLSYGLATDAILFSLDTLSTLTIANGLTINGTAKKFATDSIQASTTAPTADNTSGYLQIVVLSSEPATRYNGYWYIIIGS